MAGNNATKVQVINRSEGSRIQEDARLDRQIFFVEIESDNCALNVIFIMLYKMLSSSQKIHMDLKRSLLSPCVILAGGKKKQAL